MSARTWYLYKAADKDVFGPTDLATLKSWASEAKISPLDKISADNRQSWNRAPMVAELQMDMLVQMPDHYLYGPTNVATIQEFLAGPYRTMPGIHRTIEDQPGYDRPVEALGAGFRVDGTVPAATRPAPPLGGDSRAVLDELGFASGEIDAMAKDGVI